MMFLLLLKKQNVFCWNGRMKKENRIFASLQDVNDNVGRLVYTVARVQKENNLLITLLRAGGPSLRPPAF
jgi:hypothetical protein